MNVSRCAGPVTIDALREMGRRDNPAVGELALRFGISTPMLYVCMRLQSEQQQLLAEVAGLRAEIGQLQDDLQRAREERDMLRNGHRILSLTAASQPKTRTSKKKGAHHAAGQSSAPGVATAR